VRTVIIDRQCVADVQGRRGVIAVLVSDGRCQGDDISRTGTKHPRVVWIAGIRVNDRTYLIEGDYASSIHATTDQLVFSVSVDAAGVVTFDQVRSIWHQAPACRLDRWH